MTITQKPVTAEELLMMPDKDLRTELVRGEVRRMAPAGNVHGRLAVKVAARLLQHVEDNDLGVGDVGILPIGYSGAGLTL